ncbi:hypothetical protein U0070_022546 [Myodes glareolus]|uniref:Uncharacterized protein n=1 Tax=Myodes glareolus TaxID=447135 RepID=A0AAW0HGW2_MYOGA
MDKIMVKAFGNLLYEIRSNPHWLLRPFLDLSQHGLSHKSQRLWSRVRLELCFADSEPPHMAAWYSGGADT